MQSKEEKKRYQQEYNRRKKDYFEMLKKTDNLELLSNTKNQKWKSYVFKFTKRSNMCRRCERLLKYAGQGDGLLCSECLDEHFGVKKPYYSQTNEYKNRYSFL